MAQGVIYYDSEARIISGNPAAERILGVRLDQVQGRSALDPSFNATHEDGSDLSTETHPAVVSLRTGKNTVSITMRIFNPEEGRISLDPHGGYSAIQAWRDEAISGLHYF